jgi:lipopolysaccharide/colanic/teichoic acid biosynthesis glycosyltransferase
VSNADALIEDLEDKNEKSANGQLFKIKDDPRVTRVGRFLRKWSLDELPQIINVYKREMSLVGPRPPLPREVEHYCSEHYCRLKGLPGITGLWQVSGRSDLSFDEMVKLDKYYLDNWSLRLDLSIMLKTIVVVLARRGAY